MSAKRLTVQYNNNPLFHSTLFEYSARVGFYLPRTPMVTFECNSNNNINIEQCYCVFIGRRSLNNKLFLSRGFE